MKILMLTLYENLGASSRLRFFQYVPWLERCGIQVTISSLLSNEYIRHLQDGGKNKLEVLKGYFSRLKIIPSLEKYDILWIEKECYRWLPAWFERILVLNRIPYVLDYDDAVFHNYDQHPNFLIRYLLANKHPQLMRSSALVIAGNYYLADFARKAGAKNIETIPTAIDLNRYQSYPSPSVKSQLPCIGWIGQRSTASYLHPFAPLFKRLLAEGKSQFLAIGINTQQLGIPMESVPWSEETEVEQISRINIGIMPLDNSPFIHGKCGYKLIQYMACGLPVVASPVGVNTKIIEHGVNGFLAGTLMEWETALERLLSDPDLSFRMGQAGRQKVEREYCVQVTAPRLIESLRNVMYSRHDSDK
ncbi:hypothetical protein B7O87_01040 [Cylindrospermopsis raciborskii CENA303]|uniref:Glycosyl transferase family 1 n=2 Tax=Cylindrospermopsis raciborskii TaxID=77022 RepID=A0A1X4GIU9_9CYAN|nr:hypothetical protein B7O87_01040 [Cylindrospermopsis raciborskii CENA303]